MSTPNIRKCAFSILVEVLKNQHNIDFSFEKHLKADMSNASWIKALCFGILKKTSILDFIITDFAKKPLPQKDLPLKIIAYIGLYQLLFMEVKPHAAIFETVELAKKQGFKHASGFMNALLQHVSRNKEKVLKDIPLAATFNHPAWLIDKIKSAYPKEWQEIIAANNEHPPLFLRVNTRKGNREDYVKKLSENAEPYEISSDSPVAIEILNPLDVKTLPGFAEGSISVQDPAAQQAAFLLDLQDGQKVLDACAAPGGKTCHILETAQVELIAVDQDATRMQRVKQNLERLDLKAETLVADAASLDFPANTFDRILLDAPCSGTGVIRRHPDIRFLRRETDIPALTKVQGQILAHLWPMLKPGGVLLYATCSILPDENDKTLQNFLAKTPDAKVIPLELSAGKQTPYGWQFLPSAHGPDGFYYAKLEKLS